jgi:peptidoglycan-N-acetylglucosamine deacetylase
MLSFAVDPRSERTSTSLDVRPEPAGLPEQALLLSVDFEDWHQLVRRRVGDPSWHEPGPALERETDALLELFDRLSICSTFFFLGIAVRAHPELVRMVVAAGHEVGCHGDSHLPVSTQTPEQFGADLRSARSTIEEVTGSSPLGYRAPAFSLPRDTWWPFEVLAAEGFAYDASHGASLLPGNPVTAAGSVPYAVPGIGLWEFPVAAWRSGPISLPVGGASYWTVTPTAVVLRGLSHAGAGAGLYLHPHEFDPQPLRPLLGGGVDMRSRSRAWLRATQRNATRWRAHDVMCAIADRFQLMTYGEAYARLHNGVGSRP